MTINNRLKIISVILLPALLVGMGLVFSSTKAEALTGAGFKAGRIIDDAVFYDSASMDPNSIQAFLNSKVPSCDTNGTQIYSGSTTRAQYGTSRGNPPPYVCLKNYSQTVPAIVNGGSDLCKGSIAGGAKSSATIIFEVSKACGINPQVLLVLLQKEQSLVTDDWPWDIQYRSATGYGCPDTAPCDSEFYGFFNQVYQAAKAYKRYEANQTNYNYRAGRSNNILFNPNTACGSSAVHIVNQATAGLYIYTPYQPNQAALNNLYGSGDNCSAYGNRNFWRMFSDWFGPTYLMNIPGCTEGDGNLACVWKLKKIDGDKQYLVSTITERDALLYGGGFVFEGAYMLGNTSATKKAWNVPIYRLLKPNGDSFLTASLPEKNTLVANGYTFKGTDFYADPPSNSSNAGYSIYRLFSAELGTHVWVTTIAQRSEYIQKGFNYEGVAFQSLTSRAQEQPPLPNQHNIYRFYINPTNSHFFTADLSERDYLISTGKYKYEGVAWKGVFPANSKPVYRLYSSKLGEHLFTTDIGEKNALVTSGKWNLEGTSHFANTSSVGNAVYRLYSTAMNRHFWTSDVNEKNFLVNNRGFISEGIGWHQP